jgi:histidine ammonia-lyase
MVILERHDQLDLDLYRRIAFDRAAVDVAPQLIEAVELRRAELLAHLGDGRAAYGVNTGLGYFADRTVEPPNQAEFQRAILVGRAAGLGVPLSEPVVRGVMLLRLVGFLSGHAGVTGGLCRFIIDRLNDGWLPVVPASVSGAAGETVPLSHLFQTFVGEGSVRVGGNVLAASDALADRGVQAYELAAKEGIALVNGAPVAPALAIPLALRAEALLEHATLAGALAVSLTAASARPYSVRVAGLKGDPGQERIHCRLMELLAGEARLEDAPQAPVSLRVIPQVHGAVADLLDHLYAQLGRELRAVTDSPAFLPAEGDEPEGLYPTGNFHAHALTLLLDSLAIGCTHVINLAEKRLHRLLDRRFSRLPDQLARDPGLQSGVVILHKQVIGLAARARALAAPASVHAADASTGQEDFQAYTLLAADELEQILDALQLVLAHELVALRQAAALAQVRLSPPLEQVMAQLEEVVPEMLADRSLAGDVQSVCELIGSGRLAPAAPRSGPLTDVETCA